MTSLWADERVSYPVDFEPYTPADSFEQGKHDPLARVLATWVIRSEKSRAMSSPVLAASDVLFKSLYYVK